MGAREKAEGQSPRRADRAVLAYAALTAIEPVVRLLLELGITSPEAESLLRSHFVHATRAWLAARDGGADPSDVRVSLVTGVNRNMIRKILAQPPTIPRERLGRGFKLGRLLDTWHADRRYHDAHGNPMDLPERGPAPSFAALVSRCVPGASRGVVLAELMRAGAVESLPDRRLRVRTRRALPGGLGLEQLRGFGIQARAILTSLTGRLLDPSSAPFVDSTASVSIAAARLGLVRELMRRRARAFLGGLDQELAGEAARGRRRRGNMEVTVTVVESAVSRKRGARGHRA